MKNLAVLITCFNRKEITIDCLNSVFESTSFEHFNFEVFLVDDGSTDGTSDAVKTQFPTVNIIQGTGELYWNGGMILAWESAARSKKFDFYLWLNDDTNVYQNSFIDLINTSISFENESIVIGSTNSSPTEKIITYGGRLASGGLIAPNSFPKMCDYFNGNIVLVPQSVFKKLGFLDRRFRHALGDFDYGLRARKAEIKSYIAPGYLGQCSLHTDLPVWCNSKFSFKIRWEAFRTPLGHNPEEYFIFEKRHNGFVLAIYHYLTNHLRVLFPKIWKLKISR